MYSIHFGMSKFWPTIRIRNVVKTSPFMSTSGLESALKTIKQNKKSKLHRKREM